MKSIRGGIVFASGGRYIIMAVNLFSAVVMARLLTPSEYALYVLGSAIFAIADAARELGSGSYVVQQRELSLRGIQSTFTVNLSVTLAASAAIILGASLIGDYYAMPGLERYLQVVLIVYLIGPFLYPVLALMNRELRFDSIAIVGVLTTVINAVVAIALAGLGYSYMSFAWAAAASGVIGLVLALYLRPDFSIFRITFSESRSVLAFGLYDSAISLLVRIWDYMPYLILGKLTTPEIVGLWQRAMWLCLFPERILAGLNSVALPMFAEHSRAGRDLKVTYLRVIEFGTVVQWPALIFIVFFADPLVLLVLGHQWLGLVPLVKILGGALMFNFPIGLDYPILVAKGAIRAKFLLVLVQSVIATVLLLAGAQYGPLTAALAFLVCVPVNASLSLYVVRAHLGFGWLELAVAVRKSAMTSLVCAGGAAALVLVFGPNELSAGTALTAVCWYCLCWLSGLWLTGHPLLGEIYRAGTAIRARLRLRSVDR